MVAVVVVVDVVVVVVVMSPAVREARPFGWGESRETGSPLGADR